MSNNQEEEENSSPVTIITKPAKTDHPINELIAKRWSARLCVKIKVIINFRSCQMGSIFTQ